MKTISLNISDSDYKLLGIKSTQMDWEDFKIKVKLADTKDNNLSKRNETSNNKSISPMSLNEYNAMIDQSIKDVKNGDVMSHGELLNEVKAWGES